MLWLEVFFQSTSSAFVLPFFIYLSYCELFFLLIYIIPLKLYKTHICIILHNLTYKNLCYQVKPSADRQKISFIRCRRQSFRNICTLEYLTFKQELPRKTYLSNKVWFLLCYSSLNVISCWLVCAFRLFVLWLVTCWMYVLPGFYCLIKIWHLISIISLF